MLASSGETIKLWNENTLELIQDIPLSTKSLTSLAWNNDGHFLASLTHGSNEISFHAVSGRSAATRDILNIVDAPKCLQFASVSPRYLAVAGNEGKLVIWDIKSRSKKKLFHVPNSSLAKLAFSCSDSHVAVGTSDGEGYFLSNVYNTVSKPVRLFAQNHSIMDLQYSATTKSLMGASGTNGNVILVDHNTSCVVKTFAQAHSAPASGLAFSPMNNLLLLSVGYDKKFKSYDVLSKKEVLTHQTQTPLSCICFLESGTLIALGTMTGVIHIHDLRSLRCPVNTISAYCNGPIYDLKLQPKLEVKSSDKVVASVRKTVQEKPMQQQDCSSPVPKDEVTPSAPPRPHPQRPSPSLDLLSPVRGRNSPTVEAHPVSSPCSVLSQMNRNKMLSDDTGLFSPPRKGGQTFSPSLKENINHLVDLDNEANTDGTTFRNQPLQPPNRSKNPSRPLLMDDLLSPIRNESVHDSKVPQSSTSRTEATPPPSTPTGASLKSPGKSNEGPPKKDEARTNEVPRPLKSTASPEPPPATEQGAKDAPSRRLFDTLELKGGKSPLGEVEREAEVDIGLHSIEGVSKTPSVGAPKPNASMDLPSAFDAHLQLSDDCRGVSSSNDRLAFLSPFRCKGDTPRASPARGRTPPDADANGAESLPCPTCGKTGVASGNQPSPAVVQKYVAEALENYKFDMNQKFMNLHLAMVKHIFNLKKEMKSLVEQNSLNEDLLLENERLREQLQHLKHTY